MAHSLKFNPDGSVVRRDFADHAPGEAVRSLYRATNNDRRRRDGNDPFNEAFNFTQDEYDLLMKLKPELNDPDPVRRHAAWKRFAQSSEGAYFRVR